MAVFALGAAVYAPSSVLGSRLRSLNTQKAQTQQKPAFKERFEQALDPLSRALPLSPSEVSRTRAWLIQAGYREPRHLTIYVGSRVLLALLGLLIVLAVSPSSLSLLVGIPALGFFLPRFVLKRLINKRKNRITLALPDALDLTVICVEAGLALDQAMMRVGVDLHHAHPELSDEFHLVNLEMRAGKPRADSLRNLTLRTGVDDVRALVATLIQTDRFGTSVSQALRIHSDSLRTERRQRAEEKAAKTSIKMIIPLVIFILPSIMFVTLGPALIQLVRILAPDMAK
ncbi:MAG: type II secretion system F family protein [Acidobacteriaceae bacterium]